MPKEFVGVFGFFVIHFLKFLPISELVIDLMRYMQYYIAMTEKEELYRTSKAAELLNVDQTTISRWIRDGEMKAIKLNPNRKNSPYLVSKSEVDRLSKLQNQGEG